LIEQMIVGCAAALALISLGGGIYEVSTIDPVWPTNLAMVQPSKGGMSRRRFWIPAHVTFEILLVASLVQGWSMPSLRSWLLIGLASHATMRIWSGLYFIPRALAFERAEIEPGTQDRARRWTKWSRLRLPLDLVTCISLMTAYGLSAVSAA
jgi:hypothetical protein